MADLPSGSQRVCPRCGAPSGEGTWCAGCGLNLRQLQELPSADAYSARVREEEWLAFQEAQQRTEREARERQVASASDQRRAEADQRRAAARQQAAAVKQQRHDSGQASGNRAKVALLTTAVVLLLAGGGAIAYGLLSSDGFSEGADGGDPPASDGAASDATGSGSESVAEGPQSCADFETAGPSVVGVETLGIDCSEASDFILAWEDEGPGTTGSCSEPDGTFAAPCEYRGWACDSIQSGFELLAYDCSRGDQSIRWESGF